MGRIGSCVVLGALALLFVSGCSSASRGRPFNTPDEGATALVGALKPLNVEELRAILGPKGEELIDSGDEVADRIAADEFVASYTQRHRVVIDGDLATLVVGEDEWPMPIPLVRAGGAWHFDTSEGRHELLARRIGRNELSAIETCRAIVDAQREFAARGSPGREPEYAQKFASDAGQHNGLYWRTNAGEPPSPLGEEVVAAVAEGYGARPAGEEGPRPFHGYCFRMLNAQGASACGGARSYVAHGRMTGGFAAVAWPVEYENSGIMTFLVSNHGVVYQKDLGKRTERLAADMKSFDPDAGWEIVP